MSAAATVPPVARQTIVEGEYPFTQADFRFIAETIHTDAGIALQESKATLVYSRLAKRLRSLRLGSFAEYCQLVGSAEGTEERQAMLAALTTNVTRFCREPHHFEHLAKKLLPPLLARAQKGGRVRLWSSACSSGEEPYTIAMTVLGMMPDAARHDIRVLATDIDPNMIAAGKAGIYPAAAVSALPEPLRRSWCRPSASRPGSFEMTDAVRALVRFNQLNLIGQWPMRGPFDAIFCRNVMIYFDVTTQSQIWNKMEPLLAPGGALYIGHSERLCGPAAERLTVDGITTYLKPGAVRTA